MTRYNYRGKRTRQSVMLVLLLLLLPVLSACNQGEQKAEAPAVTSPADNGNAVSPQAKEHYDKGVQFSMQKKLPEAIAEYKKSLEYNPESAEAHSNLGFAYFDSGDTDQAIAEQAEAVRINPEFSNAYYGLAMAHEKKGSTQEAIDNWKKFLEHATPHTIWWEKATDRLKNLEAEEPAT